MVSVRYMEKGPPLVSVFKTIDTYGTTSEEIQKDKIDRNGYKLEKF